MTSLIDAVKAAVARTGYADDNDARAAVLTVADWLESRDAIFEVAVHVIRAEVAPPERWVRLTWPDGSAVEGKVVTDSGHEEVYLTGLDGAYFRLGVPTSFTTTDILDPGLKP